MDATTAKHARQLANSPKGDRADANSEYEKTRYLKGPAKRLRQNMLRQFTKEGPQGNSAAYIENYERIFGKGRVA